MVKNVYFLRVIRKGFPEFLVRAEDKWDPPNKYGETTKKKKLSYLFITSHKLLCSLYQLFNNRKNFNVPEYGICSFMPPYIAISVTATSLYSTIIVKLSLRMRHLLSPCKVLESTFSAHQLSRELKENLLHPGHIYYSHKRIW